MSIKIKIKTILIISIIVLQFFVIGLVRAAAPNFKNNGDILNTVVTPTGLDVQGSLQSKIGEAIAVALSLAGIMFFILMVYAGIRWLVSRGNEEEIKKAQGTIIAASIGLVIILSAYALTYLITGKIQELAKTSPSPLSASTEVGCCIDLVHGCYDGDVGTVTSTDAQGKEISLNYNYYPIGKNLFDSYTGIWVSRGLTTKEDCDKNGEDKLNANDCAFEVGAGETNTHRWELKGKIDKDGKKIGSDELKIVEATCKDFLKLHIKDNGASYSTFGIE